MARSPGHRNAGVSTYDEALERTREFCARDGPEVLPAARTLALVSGHRTPLAAVLFHGLTNNPAQYADFAPLVHARGVNVFVPRFPEHGYCNRLTTRPATITTAQLLAAATEALDIASGLGERVAVLGISMGGLIAAYCAQFRAISTAVLVAPSFALLHLPYAISRFIARIGLLLPNRFVWWDPLARERQAPLTAYPRFSTHALMRGLAIGDAVAAAACRQPPRAQRIVAVVNRNDPAVNNAVTKRIAAAWSSWSTSSVEYRELGNLPHLHDVVDPQQVHACTGLVYPELLKALGLDQI